MIIGPEYFSPVFLIKVVLGPFIDSNSSAALPLSCYTPIILSLSYKHILVPGVGLEPTPPKGLVPLTTTAFAACS